jgi:hypothetical protein
MSREEDLRRRAEEAMNQTKIPACQNCGSSREPEPLTDVRVFAHCLKCAKEILEAHTAAKAAQGGRQ